MEAIGTKDYSFVMDLLVKYLSKFVANGYTLPVSGGGGSNVTVVSSALPTNAAQETGGNLDNMVTGLSNLLVELNNVLVEIQGLQATLAKETGGNLEIVAANSGQNNTIVAEINNRMLILQALLENLNAFNDTNPLPATEATLSSAAIILNDILIAVGAGGNIVDILNQLLVLVNTIEIRGQEDPTGGLLTDIKSILVGYLQPDLNTVSINSNTLVNDMINVLTTLENINTNLTSIDTSVAKESGGNLDAIQTLLSTIQLKLDGLNTTGLALEEGGNLENIAVDVSNLSSRSTYFNSFTICNVDETSDPNYNYYGFMNSTGIWYIMREDKTSSISYFLYHGFIDNSGQDFDSAWISRSSLGYDYPNLMLNII